MGSIRIRPDTGNLMFDFRFMGIRCREITHLPDSNVNRSKAEKILYQIEQDINRGTFKYEHYFPNSPLR